MAAVIAIADLERQIAQARAFRREFPDAWSPADDDQLSDLENQLIDLMTGEHDGQP